MPIPGYLSAFLPCTDAIFIDDAPTKNPYDVWNNSIGHSAVIWDIPNNIRVHTLRSRVHLSTSSSNDGRVENQTKSAEQAENMYARLIEESLSSLEST